MNILKRIIINDFIGSNLVLGRIRIKLYKFMKLKIDSKEIRNNVYFNSEYISLERGSFINSFVQFNSGYSLDGSIRVEENCYIGMNTNICCITHEIGDANCRADKTIYKPVVIQKGAWIGANSTILPGVTVGSGCIIGAGSVVINDCEENCLYAGNPAKKIKKLEVK